MHKSLQNMLTFSLLCLEPTTSLLKQQRNQFDIKWNYGFLSGEISSPHHRRGLDLSAFLHAAVREHCPASFGPLPKAKFCSSLIPVHILFIPVTRGGGAAHLKQVEQRDSETEATCCILNFPGFLINPHFVTTINSLFQILGILEIKNSLKFFFWGGSLNYRCAISDGFHKSQTPHLLLLCMYLAAWRPDCLESVCIPS